VDHLQLAALDLRNELPAEALMRLPDELIGASAQGFDVILVGDLFYEKALAERLHAWLSEAKQEGAEVLIGDPGRSYLPKSSLTHVIDYNVPVTRDLEDAEIKRTAVWRL